MQIRHATLFDIPWLLEQLWSFNEFVNTKKSLIPLEEGRATDMLAYLIQDGYFVIAETVGGMSVGFLAAMRNPHLFNPEIIVMTELFWWVMPEFRGTSAGASLMAEYLKYGKAHADWVIVALEANSPVNPESLEKRGFKLKEHSYLLEV